MRKIRKYLVTIILAVVVIVLGFSALEARKRFDKMIYSESTDKVAVVVNGNELTLLDMAYYVAEEEKITNEQAVLYNSEDPHKYWRTKVNGEFIIHEVRESAMSKAIHDEIFYQMALEAGVSLGDEELEYVNNSQEDFWSDLTDNDAQDKLGITREQMDWEIEKAALAYKYQIIYAEIQGEAVENYDISGASYQDLLNDNKYEVRKSVWKSVDFGNVTLN